MENPGEAESLLSSVHISIVLQHIEIGRLR